MIGNRRIVLMPDGAGLVAVADEYDGIRYIVAPDPQGSGESLVDGRPLEVGDRRFGRLRSVQARR